ncbi:hypothetical protein CONLIGDRAFT_498408 [Coniochaeta ligniaria NRRL 30616]|uniref:Uncharacterized protein n=1 Tax=Coniochaeta ligniaria NRRL 30616 TaxID=1408157 RepID=A0A1J7IDT4_9PEZI|nr:hypothetical protein CONLIGDRAFT_498408 [Coniochaeta ligniaria NRRL 30616]
MDELLSIKEIPRLYVTGLCYLGAFSRFTHGRYTPAFYQYQIDHAPDDESTRLIPFVDATMGTLVLFSSGWTRTVAVLLCGIFQGIGIVHQLKKGRQVKLGVLSFVMAAAAGYLSWA